MEFDDLDAEKSNRLNRIVAGYRQRAGLSWERLAERLHFGGGVPALLALVGECSPLWRFSDACPAADALSSQYGVPLATIWSHIMEAGSFFPDADVTDGNEPI